MLCHKMSEIYFFHSSSDSAKLKKSKSAPYRSTIISLKMLKKSLTKKCHPKMSHPNMSKCHLLLKYGVSIFTLQL